MMHDSVTIPENQKQPPLKNNRQSLLSGIYTCYLPGGNENTSGEPKSFHRFCIGIRIFKLRQ